MNAPPEALDHLAKLWWPYVAHAAWQGALVGLVLLVVVFLGRRWPSPLRYWILVIALAKFVVPPMVSAPTGLFRLIGPIAPSAASTPLARADQPPRDVASFSPVKVDFPLDPPSPASDFKEDLSQDHPIRKAGSLHSRFAGTIENPVEQPQAEAPRRRQLVSAASTAPVTTPPSAGLLSIMGWKSWLMVIHFTGIVVLAGWTLGQFLKLRRVARHAKPISDGPLYERFLDVCRRVRVKRRVQLIASRAVTAPLAFGVARPTVIVPASLFERLPDQDFEMILAHELAHVRRGDAWINWAQVLLCVAWWFHPMVWLLNGAIRRVREDCCDDLLISQGIATQADYCDTLVRVAASLTPREPVGVALGMAPRLHPLAGRLKRIMDAGVCRSARMSLGGCLAAVAVSALVLPGLDRGNGATASETGTAEEESKVDTTQDRQGPQITQSNAVGTPVPIEQAEQAKVDRVRAVQGAQNTPFQAEFENGNVEPLEAAEGQEKSEQQLLETLLDVASALAELGKKADTPAAVYDQPASLVQFASTIQKLAILPAVQRYQLLKLWTLPVAGRSSVRLLGNFVFTEGPPPDFSAVDYRRIAPKGVLNSADLLIEFARDAGKLDELSDALLEVADAGVPNAEALWILVEIARAGDAEVREQLEQIVAQLPAKLAEANRARGAQPVEWTDFLLARACLNDPALRRLGENYARTLIYSPHQWSTMNGKFVMYMIQEVIHNPASDPVKVGAGADPKLALWHPGSDANSIVHELGVVPMYWSEHNGEVRHDLGAAYDFLFFAYPLTGSFEFSADCYFTEPGSPVVFAPSINSSVCYGGLVANRIMTWVVGMQDRFFPPSPVPAEEGFLRMTVQVEPGRVRFLQDGKLYYEEPGASPTSPWVALSGTGRHLARFRNLQLKGNPVIPREVRLTHEDRLDGWISSFYFESQPRQRRNAPRKVGNIMPWAEPEHADWYADTGVIYGRKRSGPPADGTVMSQLYYRPSLLRKFDRVWEEKVFPVPSRLYYNRPLRDGDTLSYEFVYEPDRTMVHPSLGQLTFLLEPEGVRLHWITDTPFDDPTGLPHDNVIDVPNDRRGPEQLPLKPGEWNQVTISLTGDTAVLTLNGVDIYERELQKTNGRFFGLFHWKDRTAVEVRNVVLRGDWPEKLSPELMANLLTRTGDRAASESE